MKLIHPLHVACALSVVLSAGCSSSDDGPVGGGGNNQAVTINQTNSNAVAGGLTSALSLIAFQDFADFSNVGGFSDVTDCPDGGTITDELEIDEAPMGVISSGDRYAVTFADCAIDILMIGGRLVFDFNTVDGDPQGEGSWDVDIDVTFDQITFSGGAAGGSFDGGWNMTSSYDDTDESEDFSLSGDFMTEVNDGQNVEMAELRNIVLTCEYDADLDRQSYTIDGTFSSSDLGGQVTMTTVSPLQIMGSDDDYPFSGVLRINGDGGSKLRMTAIDSTFVMIEIDADGDGDYEYNDTVMWTELEEDDDEGEV